MYAQYSYACTHYHLQQMIKAMKTKFALCLITFLMREGRATREK